MSPTLMLAWKSVNNRRLTAFLTILTVAVSLVLLLGVERIRTQAKASFANTISGTDLIVGGRSGQVNLLLYSVFRIGNATNNISTHWLWCQLSSCLAQSSSLPAKKKIREGIKPAGGRTAFDESAEPRSKRSDITATFRTEEVFRVGVIHVAELPIGSHKSTVTA